ncbi:MAG: hypothetical protein AAF485_04540, partial [Chloroflexota bacterium]
MMISKFVKSTLFYLLIGLSFTTVAQGRPLFTNPSSGTTTTGQTLEIIIDSPPNGETVTIPSGEVDVTGRVSLTGLDAAANI